MVLLYARHRLWSCRTKIILIRIALFYCSKRFSSLEKSLLLLALICRLVICQRWRLWNLSSIPWRIYCLESDIMIENILISLTRARYSRDWATSLDLYRIICILKIIVAAHEIRNAWVITIIVRRSVTNSKKIAA